MARLYNQSHVVNQVLQGIDVAALSGVDCPDVYPVKIVSSLDTSYDHLDLKLKSLLLAVQHLLHETTTNQSISRLVVWNCSAHSPGKGTLTQPICQPANWGHILEISGADD